MRRLALIAVMSMALAACAGADEPATNVTVVPGSTGATVHSDDSMSDGDMSDEDMSDDSMSDDEMTDDTSNS